MCLCWHSYLCWRFILVCVKMIVAPWILKCATTWLKTFEHASCSLPIAISLCIDCWGLFHACSFIFEHFYQEFGCCFFFVACRYFRVDIGFDERACSFLLFVIQSKYHVPLCVMPKSKNHVFYSVQQKFVLLVLPSLCLFSPINCINKRELITILWCSDDEALRFRFGVVECVLAASFFCSDITFLST